jgi:hypothetical protein
MNLKWDGEAWTGMLWVRMGTGGGAGECGNKFLGLIKCGKFLD